MRKLLLGPTPDLHTRQAARVRGSLRWSNIAIVGILAVVAALWLLHFLSLIPPIIGSPPVPAGFAKLQTPVAGGTGFMVDASHLVTTQDALVGVGQTTAVGAAITASFPGEKGTLGDPEKGAVVWISEEVNGVRVVLVKMEVPQTNFLVSGEEPLVETEAYRVAGFDAAVADRDILVSLPVRMLVAEGMGTVDWGDRDVPAHEGFAVLFREEDGSFKARGVLSGGLLAVPLPVADLQAQGVAPPVSGTGR